MQAPFAFFLLCDHRAMSGIQSNVSEHIQIKLNNGKQKYQGTRYIPAYKHWLR